MDWLNSTVALVKIFIMFCLSSSRPFRRMAIFILTLNLLTPGMLYHLPESSVLSDVTYEELIQLNATCPNRDSCRSNRITEDLQYVNCHCDSSCTVLDTCCVDSNYKTAEREFNASNINCRSVYGNRNLDVFMVDHCKRNWAGDNFVEDLCLGDGQAMNDPFLLIPVTSLQTGITYKNYFCSVCNEDIETASPTFWNLKLTGESKNVLGPSLPNLSFNESIKLWKVLSDNESEEPFYASVKVQIPDKLQTQVKTCHKDIIKDCSDKWSDDTTKKKCSSYMAMILIDSGSKTKIYKNPHCAICNFEDVANKECFLRLLPSPAHAPGLGSIFVGLFSLEDKINRCSRNMVYDKFTKKCRVFRCGKNRTIEKGKCVIKSS